MKRHFKRIFTAFLAVLIFCCSLAVPSYAADFVGGGRVTEFTGGGRYVSLLLDDGSALTVLRTSIQNHFIVVQKRVPNGLGIKRYAYVIYNFGDETPANGDVLSHKRYLTDYYLLNDNALTTEDWSSDTYNVAVDIFEDDGDTILFSTYDFYSADGTLLYDSSVSVNDDQPPAVGGGQVTIAPNSYDGLLPDLSTITGTKTDNYIVLKSPDYQDYLYSSGGYFLSHYSDGFVPIVDEDTRYVYEVLYFTDDFEIELYSANIGSHLCPHYIPSIRVSAGAVYRYWLDNDAFSQSYVTDATFSAADPADSVWYYDGVYNTDQYLTPTAFYTGAVWADRDLLQSFLDDWLIASSFSASLLDVEDEYSYFTSPENADVHYAAHDDEWGLTTFTAPTVGWSACDFDGVKSEIETTDTNIIVAWLQRIYNAIVNGFNAVLDKMGISYGDSVDIEDPELNQDVEEGDGFSLLDILRVLWNGLKRIVSGFWNLVVGSVMGLISDIGDFFDYITDTDSELYDFFNGSETRALPGWLQFYSFLGDFWSCVPGPIRTFTFISFFFTLFFALMKMFH